MPDRFLLLCITLASVVGLFAPRASAQAPVQTPGKPTVVRSYPHEPTAFTEGLVLFEGKLFESTGLEGRSTLQRVDIATGKIEKKIELERALFGEGLARVGRRLYQLTWKNGVAIQYDLDSFAEQRRFSYAGEGWGICYDGVALVMSNGSARLSFRDPETFAEIRSVQVVRGEQPLLNINELECVQGQVYANVWMTDLIVAIDPSSGKVTAEFNAAGLLSVDERRGVDVLNGIAFIPESGNFYITGKYWPKLFEVTLPGTSPSPSALPIPAVPQKLPTKSKQGCDFVPGAGPWGRQQWLSFAAVLCSAYMLRRRLGARA